MLRIFTVMTLSAACCAPEPPAASRPDATTASTRPEREESAERIVIAGESFKLEVAADQASRTKGLMGRTAIADDEGMLFIHPEPGPLAYWMKNCLVDMDIMFIDERGRITACHTMTVEPRHDVETESQYERRLRTYPSGRFAQFAIELQAGTIERLKLKPGMTIDMDLARLKKLGR